MNNTKKLIKHKINKQWLVKNRFQQNRICSVENNNIYFLRFPVYKYKKRTLIEGEINVEINTGDVIINVFDCNTKGLYAPFYNNDYGNNEIIPHINRCIDKKMNELGISKKERFI